MLQLCQMRPCRHNLASNSMTSEGNTGRVESTEGIRSCVSDEDELFC